MTPIMAHVWPGQGQEDVKISMELILLVVINQTMFALPRKPNLDKLLHYPIHRLIQIAVEQANRVVVEILVIIQVYDVLVRVKLG